MCVFDEQLSEIYRCVREVLERGYPINQEQEKLLEKVEEQIRGSIPDMVGPWNQSKEEVMKTEVYRGMTPKM